MSSTEKTSNLSILGIALITATWIIAMYSAFVDNFFHATIAEGVGITIVFTFFGLVLYIVGKPKKFEDEEVDE